jgi:hypothetical protein
VRVCFRSLQSSAQLNAIHETLIVAIHRRRNGSEVHVATTAGVSRHQGVERMASLFSAPRCHRAARVAKCSHVSSTSDRGEDVDDDSDFRLAWSSSPSSSQSSGLFSVTTR